LGGFEVLSSPKDDLSVIYVRPFPHSLVGLLITPLQTMGGLMPDAMAYAPPEVKKEGWSALKE
jgi:SCY1-like protein 1